MPTVLPVTIEDLKRLLTITDSDQDGALTALLAAEQPAHEYALDPGMLAASAADAGLLATLVLGVAEVMAGNYLQQVARTAGYGENFRLGTLEVTPSPGNNPAVLGPRLTEVGLKRLAPFSKAARMLARPAGEDSPDEAAPVPLLLGSTEPGPSAFDAVFDPGCGGRL